MIDNMYENLELLLFSLTCILYVVAWVWHLRGWQLDSEQTNPGCHSDTLGRLGFTFAIDGIALVPGRTYTTNNCLRVCNLFCNAGNRGFPVVFN